MKLMGKNYAIVYLNYKFHFLCSVKMMIMDWRNSFIHILWNVKCKNIFQSDMLKLKVDIQSTLLILFCWNFQVFLHTLILTPTINNKTDSKIREIREIKWNERRKTKTKQRPRWVLEWNGSTLWQQIKLTHIHTYIHTYRMVCLVWSMQKTFSLLS